MDDSWFFSVDDSKIKIRAHIKKRLVELDVDDLVDNSISAKNFDEADQYLLQSKKQYLKKDDKWILSMSNYLMLKGNNSLKYRNFNNAIEDYLDSLNLQELQREKYINIKNEELLKKCGKFIKFCTQSIANACACSILNQMSIVDLNQFKKEFILKIKSIGSFKMSDEEVLQSFLSGIAHFEFKISVFDLIDIKNKLTSIDALCLNNIKYYLDRRKKFLRRKVFDRKSIRPQFDRGCLLELSACHYNLSKIYEEKGKRANALLELSHGNRYNAYLSNSIEEIKKYFDRSIALIENIDMRHSDINYQREFLFAKARKAEYLAFSHDDLGSRIKYLKLADKYFGRLKDPRSYLASFLSLYYKIKQYIVEDNNFQLGIEFARMMIDKENDSKSLLEKYPNTKQLYFICSLIRFFPLRIPKEKELKRINEIQYKITYDGRALKPLWEIIYAYNLLMRSTGDNKDLNRFFKEAIISFLQSGTSRKIEEVASRLFFSEPADKVSKELIDYLRKEEGQNLEFKASFSMDVKAFLFSNKIKYEPEIEEQILKAIVGFLNSSGGSLFMGILEKRKDFLQFKDKLDEKFNKYIFGVEREFKKNENYDVYIRRIEDTIRIRIDPNLPSLLKLQNFSLLGHLLLHIFIPKAKKWYYLDNRKFYVREHNETIIKDGVEADEYKALHQR